MYIHVVNAGLWTFMQLIQVYGHLSMYYNVMDIYAVNTGLWTFMQLIQVYVHSYI